MKIRNKVTKVYIFVLVTMLCLVSVQSVWGYARIRESGSDTFIEDTDGGTVWVYSDSTWINMTDLNSTIAGSGSYAYDGNIHTTDGNNWTATDDNLQLALDDLTNGGTVYVPSGRIVVDRDLYINYSDVTFQGCGNSTIIEWSNARMYVQEGNLTMRDFMMVGNASGTDHTGIIRIYHTRGTDLRNYLFENIWGVGITKSSVAANSWGGIIGLHAYNNVVGDATFINCHAIDVDAYGFRLTSAIANPGRIENVTYIECSAINCGRFSWDTTATQWTTGFDIEWDCSNIQYIGCRAVRNWESGFHTEFNIDCDQISYISCIADDNGIDKAGAGTYRSGFFINDNTTITNSFASGNFEAGIQIAAGVTNPCENFTISNNYVDGKGVTIAGITSQGNFVEGCEITGNTVTGCTHGIYMHHVNDSIISLNRISKCVTSGFACHSSKNTDNNLFDLNWIEDCGTWGFRLYGNNNSFLGNRIKDVTYGIEIEAGSYINNSIDNNRISGATDCIWLNAGVTDTTIQDNNLWGFSGEAIDNDGTNTLSLGNRGGFAVFPLFNMSDAVAGFGWMNAAQNRVEFYDGADWFHSSGGGAGDGFRTQEEIEDFVGAMVTGNTETNITVTYNDAGGKLNFVVPNDGYIFDGNIHNSSGNNLSATQANLQTMIDGGNETTIVLPEGDIAIDGDTNDCLNINGVNITLKGYNTVFTVDGVNTVDFQRLMLVRGYNITIEGITFDGTGSGFDGAGMEWLVSVNWGDDITFRNCRFINSGGSGFAAGSDDAALVRFKILNCLFDNIGEHGIYFTGNQNTWDSLVDDCIFLNWGSDAEGNNIRGYLMKVNQIHNSTFSNIYAESNENGDYFGVGPGAYGFVMAATAENITIDHVQIIGNGSNSKQILPIDQQVNSGPVFVRDCLFFKHGAPKFQGGYSEMVSCNVYLTETASALADVTDKCVFRNDGATYIQPDNNDALFINNECYDIGYFRLSSDCSYSLIQNNVFDGCVDVGNPSIFYVSGEGFVIDNNVFKNGVAGEPHIHTLNFENVTVSNNKVFDDGMLFNDNSAGANISILLNWCAGTITNTIDWNDIYCYLGNVGEDLDGQNGSYGADWGAGGSADGYAGASGHPHNQDVNTTSTPQFENLTIGSNADADYWILFDADTNDGYIIWDEENNSFNMSCDLNVSEDITANFYYGNGTHLTGISGVADGYAGATGHPHNQNLNTTSGPTFSTVSADVYFSGNVSYGDYIQGDLDQDFDVTSWENLRLNRQAYGNVTMFLNASYTGADNKNVSIYGGDGDAVQSLNLTYGSMGGHISTDGTSNIALVPSSSLVTLYDILGLNPTDFPGGLSSAKGMLWSCEDNASLLYHTGTEWIDITVGDSPPSDGYAYNGTIQNSEGNSWTATGPNIQLALDDCNNTGNGTVWLPSNATLTVSDTVVVGFNITLDFNGATIEPDADFDVVVSYPQSAVINGRIDVSDLGAGFTSACIAPEPWDGSLTQDDWRSDAYYANRTYIHNMEFVGDYNHQGGSGIYFHNDNTAYHHFFWYWVTECDFKWLDTAINVSIEASGGSFNGNTFIGVHGIGCKYFIRLWDENGDFSTPEIAGNTFDIIQYQPRTFTTDYEVIYNAGGDHNTFTDLHIWDWSQAETSYTIFHNASARGNVVTGTGNVNTVRINDQGTENTFWGGHEAQFYDLNVTSDLVVSNDITANEITTVFADNTEEVTFGLMKIYNESGPDYAVISDIPAGAGLKIDTTQGVLSLNPYASQQVQFYAQCGVGENQPVSTYGDDPDAGESRRALQWKWQDNEGLIYTNTGGGNISINPHGGQVNITGSLNVSSKIDCVGGVDPPYVLFNRESIFSVFERIQNEVPHDIYSKYGGQAIFYNADIDNMMLINPKTGDTREFVWKTDFDALEDRVVYLETMMEQLLEE